MVDVADTALLGFWPLNEPSGSPVFHNYSIFYGAKPSGISFDLHVNDTNNASATYVEPRAVWPGTDAVFNPGSGTTYRGYRVQGSSDRATNNVGPLEKVLVLGRGGWETRAQWLPPPVANSGFTVGLWVNPQSDGYADLAGNIANDVAAGHHGLVSQCINNAGYIIGVSGLLINAAQNNSDANNRQLRAFVQVLANQANITTPIESGRYTHLTFTHTFIGTTGPHQVALYKDGILAANTTYTANAANALDIGNTAGFLDHAFSIGGGQNGATQTRSYTNALGWGHLVSGVYVFRRPLTAAEITSLHNTGGLQGNNGFERPTATEVSITDSKLLAYYPFISPGYIDASKNHRPLIAISDEGDETAATQNFFGITGPFNRGGAFNANNGGAAAIGLATASGIVNDLVSNKSFTIAGWFVPRAANAFANNILLGFGSVTANQTPAANQSMGFYLQINAAANNTFYRLRSFNGGNSADVTNIDSFDKDIMQQTESHVAIVYDDQTPGMALYLNGVLQNSGTLTASINPNMTRLAGSGFPLVFLNGVDTNIIDTYVTTGGKACGMHDLAIMGRPLRADEIQFLAQSGINLTPLQHTVQDPRLRGYWKGTEFDERLTIIPDQAAVFFDMPGNMCRSATDLQWSTLEGSDQKSALYRIDYFGQSTTPPAALASFGSLGFGSGILHVMGGSRGSQKTNTGKSSIAAMSLRYKPAVAQRSVRQPHFFNEYVVGFEVTPSGSTTPSGNIPKIYLPFGQEFNSLIFNYGKDVSTGHRLVGFLTSINANGSPENAASSGISLVFAGGEQTGATTFPLVSGNIAFGVPSRVLFHVRATNPYILASTNEPVTISLYIAGTLIHRREVGANTARIWPDQTPDSTSDDDILAFGGVAVNDSTTAVSLDGGLGNNYVRNMFIMNGKFSQGDINQLATSGIYDTSFDGFTDGQTLTVLTKTDTNLQGYWRFTGGPNGSGTLDLSGKGNNLTALARIASEAHLFASNANNAATRLRFVPGPYLNGN